MLTKRIYFKFGLQWGLIIETHISVGMVSIVSYAVSRSVFDCAMEVQKSVLYKRKCKLPTFYSFLQNSHRGNCVIFFAVPVWFV